MKKIMSVFLILLMLAIPLVSCMDSKDGEDTGANTNGETVGDGSGDSADSGSAEPNDAVLEIPNERFDGTEFTFLTPSIVTYCYAIADFDEPSEDPYEQALYQRNLAIEEQFGITVSHVESNIGADVYGVFKTDVDAGAHSYDVCFNNMTSSCIAVGAGYCYDIDEFEYIDLDKTWWNDDCSNQLSLGGKHYMVAGDIALSDKEGLWACYFIKDFITDLGLENPYELVNNNQWTLEKMYEMAQIAAFDENADGKMDNNDRWGICTHHENWAATWQSAGLKLIEVDDDGIPQITWGSEQFNDVYAKTAEVMGDTDVVSPTDITFITTALKNGKTLFGTEIVAFIRDYRNNEPEFGILPYPKYNSDVDEYYSFIVTNSCVLTIGKDCMDTYKTGIIVEAMAAKGHDIIMPVYFESQLKSRFSRDEESSAMLDIIFEHRSYDLGVFFDWGGAYSLLQSESVNPATVFSSLERSIERSIGKSLSKIGL